jgi:hypothetical protein
MNQQQLINVLPKEIREKIYYYTLPILNPKLQNEIINYKRKPIRTFNWFRDYDGMAGLKFVL